MSDLIDLGNEKAFYIKEAQLDRAVQKTTNVYAIAYCSGDGEPVVEIFAGTKDDRLAFMQANGIDPAVSEDWALCQWNSTMQSWGTPLSGANPEVKAALQQWSLAHKPDLHLR